jgi:hypothetical protein
MWYVIGFIGVVAASFCCGAKIGISFGFKDGKKLANTQWEIRTCRNEETHHWTVDPFTGETEIRAREFRCHHCDELMKRNPAK